MKNIKIWISIIVFLVIILLFSIFTNRNKDDNEMHYGFYFDRNINIPPVGKELNMLLNSISSINNVFKSTDGDVIVMFKDGRLVYLPIKDENSFSKLSGVKREEGYWMMEPSYMTKLIINEVILSDGKKEKVDIISITHFLVENPEETGFEIKNESKIKFLEKYFILKESFIVNDSDKKILNFLNTHVDKWNVPLSAPVKVHCSVLAEQAVKSALYDYAQKTGKVIKGLENFSPDDEEDIHCH